VSTRNAKTSPPQAPAETPAQETAAAAAPVAAAVVQPKAPKAPTAPADSYSGQGGLYTMKNGKRVRVAAPAATTEEQQ
jgi:hypothetical protein